MVILCVAMPLLKTLGMKALLDPKTPHCDEPAAWNTDYGPRCDACMTELEKSASSPTTRLGVIRQALKDKVSPIRKEKIE